MLEAVYTSFGSMVQKGKFSAGMLHFVRVLYNVDLPTLGRPTMPTCIWSIKQIFRDTVETGCMS